MDLLLPLILAAVVTVVLIPLLERRAAALKVLDAPGDRKVHVRPMPRVGGVAMAAGAAASFAFWLPPGRLSVAFLIGALVVLAFGVWDDRSDLPPWLKFVGQLLAVSVVVFYGGVSIHSITLDSRIELSPVVALPLTYLFLVGVTNAINLADGLDGLAGGTTLLCFAAIAVLALGFDVPFVLTVAGAMMGSLLGFLRFNSYPARIFMGDGGSQFLGFTAGVLAVVLTQDERLPYSAALPLLLLGLPILDTLIVMVRRLSRGESPFKADSRHLHHRLLARGFDHFEAVVLIYVLQAAMFVLAWRMRYASDAAILAAFGILAGAIVLLLYVGRRSRWQWRTASGGLAELLRRRVPWLKAPTHLPRWGNLIAWVCATLYMLAVAATSTVISRDVAWLALVLGGVLSVALFGLVPLRMLGGLVHAAVFVTVAMAVYLDHIEPAQLKPFTALKWALFPVLAIAVLARLRFWRERRFDVTPLDLLVVFLALALPNLPGLQAAPSNVGVSVAKLVALMYAAELLIRHSERTRAWLWASAAVTVFAVGVRGLVP